MIEQGILGVLVVALGLIGNGIHTIHEGHIGVYWRGGALMGHTSQPGLHWRVPLLDYYEEVQTTIQTDSVSEIPCGTSGGVVVTFDKVEVVNRLRSNLARDTVANYTTRYDQPWIFDKVHHEINQFCSRHTLHEVAITLFDQIDERLEEALERDCRAYAPGIEVIAVRVTKPRIPPAIRAEFEQREAESAKLRVAEQTRLVVEARAETDARKLAIEAQRDADVAAINSQREVAQQRAEQEKQAIRDAMHLDHERALADAAAYATEKTAEANAKLLTPEYLELRRSEAIANNAKIYFGEKLPSTFITSDTAAGTAMAAGATS